MTNAMEPGREDMEQEAANELAHVEAHDFVLVMSVLPIVLPAETDMGRVEIEQTAVGDGDAMDVTREIGQDLLGAGEGFFGIDHPFGLAQRREVGCEGVDVLERGEIGEELKLSCCMQSLDSFEEQASEQAREHPHCKKEAALAGHPTLSVRRQATTWYDAMQMGMMLEVLAPGVQDGADADVGAEVLGV